MQGVDLAQYDHDLRDCRQYAGYIDRDGNTINGAVSGAIVMGILAAALGGNRRTIDQSASAGGFAGMTNMEARSAAKQERVLINCMTGRGYRALDGAYAPAPAATRQTVRAESASIKMPGPTQAPSGVDAFTAEKVAKNSQCSQTPTASLASKGAGFETYSVPCVNGDIITIRCELGNCRTLK